MACQPLALHTLLLLALLHVGTGSRRLWRQLLGRAGCVGSYSFWMGGLRKSVWVVQVAEMYFKQALTSKQPTGKADDED